MAAPLNASRKLTHDDYTVAWICALPIEKTAARNMLDELHHPPPQPDHDKNIYTFGRICGHNVVIVCQGKGTTAASVVATQIRAIFKSIRFCLLVGIAGGVPDEKDVRLGDVVVSKGDGRSGGVVAHTCGKETCRGFESHPFLDGVPELLRNAINELESQLMDRDSKISDYILQATTRNPRFEDFRRPKSVVDNLFKNDYDHVNPNDKTCLYCDKRRIIRREPPTRRGPLVHFGIVASGDQVIKDGVTRANIVKCHPGVIAVDMEAAGLMNVIGCAIIRGISDYADSHKNDGWQKYASAVAAAVAKEILSIIQTTIDHRATMSSDREEDRPTLLARIDRPATMSSYREEDDLALIASTGRHATMPLLPSTVRREMKPSDREEDGPALSRRIDRRATVSTDREEDDHALSGRIDRRATASTDREEDDHALIASTDRRATMSSLPSTVRRETKPSDREEDGPALLGRIDRRATVSTDVVEDYDTLLARIGRLGMMSNEEENSIESEQVSKPVVHRSPLFLPLEVKNDRASNNILQVFPQWHLLPIPPCGTCNRRRPLKFPVYMRSGLVICDDCLMNAKQLYSSSGVDSPIQKWTRGFGYDLGNVLRPARPTLPGDYPILNTTKLDFGPENGEFRMALTGVPVGKFEISFRIKTPACPQNASKFKKLTAKFGSLGTIAFMASPIKDCDAYLNKVAGNPSWDWKAYRKMHTIKYGPSNSTIVKLSRDYQVTAGQAIGIFVQYSWANGDFPNKGWSLHEIRLVEPCISLVIYCIILKVNSVLM